MPLFIASLTASQRLDATGNPALQVCVTTSKGTYTSLQSVPSKRKTALDTKDKEGTAHVQQAIHNIEFVISPALIGKRFDLGKDLRRIDGFMSELAKQEKGTDGPVLGKEERMAVSVACARAGADAAGIPLYEFLRQECFASKAPYIMPVPFFTVLNGDGIEYTIAPTGATSMAHAIKMGSETYHALKQALEDKLGITASHTTTTGSFSNPLLQPLESLHLLAQTIHASGHTNTTSIGLNASSLSSLNSPAKIALYNDLMSKYPITLLEDPFPEDEWESWSSFSATTGEKEGKQGVAIVDREVMCQERMELARGRGVCNGVLLELDVFPDLTAVFAAANQAFSYGWGVFISHSLAETTDSFIADLAVGLRCGHLKAGAPSRGENVLKYNRLLDIEEEIKGKGQDIKFAGEEFRVSHGRIKEEKVPFNVYGY
ncbi:enolase C-terminal domain-like protein [Halenospora varia]|nr:enolase C-terminal domain-like protein [Halenospora varia]